MFTLQLCKCEPQKTEVILHSLVRMFTGTFLAFQWQEPLHPLETRIYSLK